MRKCWLLDEIRDKESPMDIDWLSRLALFNIHKEIASNIDKHCPRLHFAIKHPRQKKFRNHYEIKINNTFSFQFLYSTKCLCVCMCVYVSL